MTALGKLVGALQAAVDSVAYEHETAGQAEVSAEDAGRAASAFGRVIDVEHLAALHSEIADQRPVPNEIRRGLGELLDRTTVVQSGTDATIPTEAGSAMSGDPRKTKRLHDRPWWEVRPLYGVGPLRFGMTYQQVVVALGGATAHKQAYTSHIKGDRMLEARFDDIAVTTYYGEREAGHDLLYGVASHAHQGPQFTLDGSLWSDDVPHRSSVGSRRTTNGSASTTLTPPTGARCRGNLG